MDWLHVRKQALLMSEVLLSLVTSTLQPPIGLCTASFLLTTANSSITRYLYHQLMWYNSLWLWWWRVLRLSKCLSLSTTVLFRTTLTQMIMKKDIENPSWAKENSTWMHHLHHNLISQEIDRKVLTSCGSTPKSLQSFSTPSGPIVSGSSWPLSEQKNKKNWPYYIVV